MRRIPSFVLVALIVSPALTHAEGGLVLLPPACRLEAVESTQRFLVQRTAGGEAAGQVSRGVEWSSSDPRIATVVDGVVRPVGDGEANIEARVEGQTASARVVVAGMGRPTGPSFRNQVEPVLAKLGCNSGAC